MCLRHLRPIEKGFFGQSTWGSPHAMRNELLTHSEQG